MIHYFVFNYFKSTLIDSRADCELHVLCDVGGLMGRWEGRHLRTLVFTRKYFKAETPVSMV